MFKWIRGFVSGTLLTIYASTIGIMVFYVWILKDRINTSNRRSKYSSYYSYKGRGAI